MPPRERFIHEEEEAELLTHNDSATGRTSEDGSDASISSISTTSLVLEHIHDNATNRATNGKLHEKYRDEDGEELGRRHEIFDVEEGQYQGGKPVDKKARRLLWIVGTICVVGWGLALASFILGGS